MAIARDHGMAKVKVKIVKFWHILIDLTAVFQQFFQTSFNRNSNPLNLDCHANPRHAEEFLRVSKATSGKC